MSPTVPCDITKCDLCLENFTAPKQLPCFHVFCLDCLRSHFKDVSREDNARCPVCEEEFHMPDDAADLEDDPFLSRLAAVGAGLEEPEECPSLCEVCAAEKVDTEIPCATQYCADCEQKLCDRCSRPHRRMKDKSHKVVDISEAARLQPTTYCNDHVDQLIRFHCCDCGQNACKKCSDECLHSKHNCKDIIIVSDEYSNAIEGDISAITSRIDDLENELEVIKDAIKYLADKNALRKEAEAEACQVKQEVLRLMKFASYCKELISKGKPTEIATLVNIVHERTGKLLKIPLCNWTPHLRSVPGKEDDLNDDEQSFIGIVQECSSESKETLHLQTAREKIMEQQLNQAAKQNEIITMPLKDANAPRLEKAKVQFEKIRQSDEPSNFDSCKKLRIS